MTERRILGFVGLGSMGQGIASQLLAKGLRVQAHDIRPAARDPWVAKGGVWADRPAAAAAGASGLVLMVVNADQVEEALWGPDGALGTLAKGSVVVVHSTIPASAAAAIGARLLAAGYPMLDAPVSGGVAAAAAGTLSVMASGSAAAFAASEDLLAATASRVFRVGDAPGMGSAVKTVNQLLAGAHIAVAAEAMAFGARSGVDTRVLYDVITHCAGNSWMFANRVPHMLDDDYQPRSAVTIFVKDLGIVLDSARELGFPAPMTALAHQLFIMAAGSGHAAQDDAAVVKVYEAMSGARVAQPRKDPAA